MKITDAILHDSREVMTISTYNKEHDCYFSMPTVVGRHGAIDTYFLELTTEEHQQLSNSVNMLENIVKEVSKKL